MSEDTQTVEPLDNADLETEDTVESSDTPEVEGPSAEDIMYGDSETGEESEREEEQEDDSEDGDKEEAEETTDDDDELHAVTVDGETSNVSYDDLVKGYQTNAHDTQGMQKLAAERK